MSDELMRAGEAVEPLTAYRVSLNRTGDPRWWRPGETIPETHSQIRLATPGEVWLIDKIINARGQPSLALGERLVARLRASYARREGRSG